MNCKECHSENIITYLLPVKPFVLGTNNLDTVVECQDCQVFYQVKEINMGVPITV